MQHLSVYFKTVYMHYKEFIVHIIVIHCKSEDLP